MIAAMRIRDARPDDDAAIASIYGPVVERTTASWSGTPVDAADRREWLAAKQAAGWPVIVAEDAAGQVLGFGALGAFRPSDGYRLTAEHSVYVRDGGRGAGVGDALLAELIRRARERALHVLVAAIDGANEGSIRFHERRGFVEVGRMPQVGAKFGRWLELVLLQLVLDERPAPDGA